MQSAHGLDGDDRTRFFVRNREKQRSPERFRPAWPRKHLYFKSLPKNSPKHNAIKITGRITGQEQGHNRAITGGRIGAAGDSNALPIEALALSAWRMASRTRRRHPAPEWRNRSGADARAGLPSTGVRPSRFDRIAECARACCIWVDSKTVDAIADRVGRGQRPRLQQRSHPNPTQARPGYTPCCLSQPTASDHECLCGGLDVFRPVVGEESVSAQDRR